MGIIEALRALPEYIHWVRQGRPEVSHKNINDPPVVYDVKKAISDLLNNGARRSWVYDLGEGMTEMGDPPRWSETMPSWIKVFPELDGTTLTEVHAQSREYNPITKDTLSSLIMDFRNLTTGWTIYTNFCNLESQISIKRTEAGEDNEDVYQGEEDLKLMLIKEAWQMAAKLRSDVRNST